MKQHESVESLLKLIKENPDREIVPMVAYDICQDDGWGYWMGVWNDARLDEYYVSDERVYFRSQDEDDLIDTEYDKFWGTNTTDEEAMERAKEIVQSYAWVKCIAVHIEAT